MPRPRRLLSILCQTAPLLCLLALVIPPATRADVDREARERREREKAADEARGSLGGDGPVDPGQKLAEEGQANLKTISELMKKIQGNLNEKKTGQETQALQKDVTKKIDDLIEKILEASQQSSSSSQGSSGQEQQKQKGQSGKDQKQGQQQQKNEKQGQMRPDQQSGKKPEQQGQKKQESGQEQKGPTRHDQVSDGKNPDGKPGNLTDIFGSGRQWGILPRRLRDAAFQTSDRQFPAEYRDLISKYYERLANLYSERASDSD